ncbi:hypothetical protein AAE478_009099 [Parahypoxylon ruwenzoriense]
MTAKPRAAFGDRLSELTTIFDPPCSTTWLLTATKAPSQYPRFPTAGPTSCDPPLWLDNIVQKGFAYYSPAICPIGFTAGCTASDGRADEGFSPITAGETAMYCIPSGFTCTSDTTDFRGGVWGYQRTPSESGALVTVGPALQIRWRDEDLNSLATHPLIPDAAFTSILISTDLVAPTSNPADPATRLITPIVLFTPTISSGFGVGEPSPTEFTSSSSETGASASVLISPPGSTVTSDRPKDTRTPSGDSGDIRGGNGTEGTGFTVASSTSMAAIAMSGILILLILGFVAIALFRRYHRYRAGKIEAFLPFRLGIRISRMFEKWSNGSASSQRSPVTRSYKSPDAELGTDGPIPELGPGPPLGTKENPAELAGNSERNSWMSRVSRIFTVRLKKEVWSI